MKWFSHDVNSRSNRKLRKVLRTHGMVGYGIWWALLEELCELEELGFQQKADELWLESFAETCCISDHRTLTRVFDTFAEVSLISPQLWAEHYLYVPAIAERGDAYAKKRAKHAEAQARYRGKQNPEGAEQKPSKESGDTSLTITDCHFSKSDKCDSPYSDPYAPLQANLQAEGSLRAQDLNRASERARGGANLPNEPAQQPAEKAQSSSARNFQAPLQEKEFEVGEIIPGEFFEINSASPSKMPQEAALTSTLVQTIIPPNSKPLAEASRRDPFFGKVDTAVLIASIAAFNQAAPETWNQTPTANITASPTGRHLLKKLALLHGQLAIESDDPDGELAQLLGHAGMGLRTSSFHSSATFDNRHLGFLLMVPGRIHEWAIAFQSLPDSKRLEMEKEVFQVRQTYQDLEGKECTRDDVIKIAIAIDKNLAGEVEKNWLLANFGNDEKEVREVEYLLKKWGMNNA
jgi:hypothetical protein